MKYLITVYVWLIKQAFIMRYIRDLDIRVMAVWAKSLRLDII